ncbi:MAG TPA: hypothetical protein VNO83_01640, partial [Pseudonocardia sp.]|nr:hypothetical protein [Pseudonocardia sp.]
MSDVRWEGMTHAEIFRRVQAGPGRGASAAVESAWVDTESVIRGIEEGLVAAIEQAGSGWEGAAADATRAGLTPLGRWAADAVGDARLTAGGVQAQGEQAAWLRSAMPSPTTPLWDEPAGRPAPDPLYILEDVEALERRGAEDAAQAVHLMNTYTSNSYANISAMDYWTVPPPVTVETVTAQPAGPAGASPALGPSPGTSGGVGAGAAPGVPPGPAPSSASVAAGAAAGLPAPVPPVPPPVPGASAPGRAGAAARPGSGPRGPGPSGSVPPGRIPGSAPGSGGAGRAPGPPRPPAVPSWRDLVPGTGSPRAGGMPGGPPAGGSGR